jgi:hypothetical protein
MLITPKIFSSKKWLKLTDAEPLIVFALLVRADKSMVCFPNIETIAADTRTSMSTVKRTLKTLEEKKALVVNRTRGTAIENGRNVIKSKNIYNLSVWGKYCGKESKRFKKTEGHHDTSQKLCNVNSDTCNSLENIDNS